MKGRGEGEEEKRWEWSSVEETKAAGRRLLGMIAVAPSNDGPWSGSRCRLAVESAKAREARGWLGWLGLCCRSQGPADGDATRGLQVKTQLCRGGFVGGSDQGGAVVGGWHALDCSLLLGRP